MLRSGVYSPQATVVLQDRMLIEIIQIQNRGTRRRGLVNSYVEDELREGCVEVQVGAKGIDDLIGSDVLAAVVDEAMIRHRIEHRTGCTNCVDGIR